MPTSESGKRTLRKRPTPRDVLIAPSLICADLCNLERAIQEFEAVGVDLLHVDVIDAQFSPCMPIGIETVAQLRRKTKLPFDVHLMVKDNEFFVREFTPIGAQRLCFHVESAFHIDRILNLIREQGILAGVALMPATPLCALDYIVEQLDFVTLSLISPGFANSKSGAQVPYAVRKVADCRRYLDERGRAIPIQVDGRVSFATIPGLVAAGADILVAGSTSLFDKSGSLAQNAAKMRDAIQRGLEMRREKHD